MQGEQGYLKGLYWAFSEREREGKEVLDSLNKMSIRNMQDNTKKTITFLIQQFCLLPVLVQSQNKPRFFINAGVLEGSSGKYIRIG